MQSAISEAEILELLIAIESGTVQLTPIEEPQRIYGGVVEHVVNNGWRLAVFNDCNSWERFQCDSCLE